MEKILLSQRVDKLCGDYTFHLFLEKFTPVEWNYFNTGIMNPHLKSAKIIIKHCRIESIKELDTDADARRLFMGIMDDFGMYIFKRLGFNLHDYFQYTEAWFE